jgi:TnpA family transposase
MPSVGRPEEELSVIKQRRGDANRLGFAVLLCPLRYPGYALSAGERPPDSFLTMVACQLGVIAETGGR